MVAFVEALPAGNALRLSVQTPDGMSLRVLRRTDANFVGPNDSAAFIIADQFVGSVLMDVANLVNGEAYFYQDYATADGVSYTAQGIGSGTPAVSYTADGHDPQVFVRTRVQLGINAEIAAGRLLPTTGKIAVINSPFGLPNMTLPAVSVHLQDMGDSERFIGDSMLADVAQIGGSFQEISGWLARWSINITAVALNPDERIAIRQALMRVLIANQPVFGEAGMSEVKLSFQDQEQLAPGSEAAILYQVVCSLTCLAPAILPYSVYPIASVAVSATQFFDPEIFVGAL